MYVHFKKACTAVSAPQQCTWLAPAFLSIRRSLFWLGRTMSSQGKRVLCPGVVMEYDNIMW